MFLPLKKVHSEELLDRADIAERDIRTNLEDIRRINRYLGGIRVVRDFLRDELHSAPLRDASLLDVGTGSADIPVAMQRWCRGRGVNLRVVAADRRPGNPAMFLKPGARNGVAPLGADVFHLPFPDATFTWVTISMLLHQFDDGQCVAILRELARVARRAVLVNELERDAVPLAFITLTAPIFTRNHISRVDAAASLRQAFLPGELRTLAQRAGFTSFRVRRHFPYRLSLRIQLTPERLA